MRKYLFRLCKPIGIIPQVLASFWVFFFITIVIGQAGILCSLFSSLGDNQVTFKSLLADNLRAGNFYTFSISVIASSISPFLIEYLGANNIRFRHIKVIASLFAIVLLLLPMTFIYARTISPIPASGLAHKMAWTQAAFYVSSIIACIYLFCVSQLHYDYESYADLETEGMARLRRNQEKTTKDSKGNAL